MSIIQLYGEWKKDYTRKENSLEIRFKNFQQNQRNPDDYYMSSDGKYVNCKGDVKISDDDLIDGRFPFNFGNVNGYFDCSFCNSLISLNGAPKKVEGSFSCANCDKLVSLENAPEIVEGDFFCHDCKNLTSLTGAPKKIEGSFSCANCDSLKSLEGAPEIVGGYFNCANCNSLVSLDEAPKNVGSSFIV